MLCLLPYKKRYFELRRLLPYKKRDFELMEMTTQEKDNQWTMGSSEIQAKKVKHANIAVKTPSITTKKVPSSNKSNNKNWSCIPRNPDVGRRKRSQFLETLKEMGIHDPIFLMEKNITDSDTNKQQNRLLIPYNAFDLKSSPFSKLVNDNEKEALKEGKALNISILDQSKRVYSLTLKYLDSNKAFRIIGTDWSKFVEANKLQKGQNLELWSFQQEMDGALCFAMLNYDSPI